MESSEFKRWVEAVESRKRYVFIDLNETLITKLEDGWLKAKNLILM